MSENPFCDSGSSPPTAAIEARHEKQFPISAASVMLAPEANSGLPLRGDFERMARRRFQNPKPFRDGSWWWIRPRQDEFVGGKIVRTRPRLKVAPATMKEREVLKIASEMMRPMNQGLEIHWFGHTVRSLYRRNISRHRVAAAGDLGSEELQRDPA